MIQEYTTRSIFESNANALICPVNTVGRMGKGLALAFAQRYPDMEREYISRCAQSRLKIGSIFVYTLPNAQDSPRHLVCLPTKKHYRDPSKLEYVETGLQVFVKHFQSFDITSAAFPQIGCGLGGLNWSKQVMPLMVRYLDSLSIPVTIHLYVN